LALTLPYTFTKLTKYALFRKFKIIGESFSGNPIYVYRTGNEEAKKSIVIMGRQHPSETSGSFAIEGVINEL
jgi:murein tripeptide amidase MpaA